MNKLTQLMAVQCEKVLKTQGDCSDSLIPDSDQEDKSQSHFQRGTTKSTNKPFKRLRFSGMNQVCCYRRASKKSLSPSPTRNKTQSFHSILKNKESPILFSKYK